MNEASNSVPEPIDRCLNFETQPSHSNVRKRVSSDSETHCADSKIPCLVAESIVTSTVPVQNEVLEQPFIVGDTENANNLSSKVSPSENLSISEAQVVPNLKLSNVSEALQGPSQSSVSIPSSSTASGVQGRGIINAGITEEEINEIINGLGDDVDLMLDMKAEKHNLTAKNVKSILMHVISNKYVLAMVRNTMRAEKDEECELEEAVFEPILTRSKTKELREKNPLLAWQDESTVKNRPLSNKLLLEEFSDNEGSSDEEYTPNEEDLRSEEEVANRSTNENSKNTDFDSEDFPSLFIAEPELSSNENDKDQVDQIALRTRSKLPLTDTPLETIVASYFAPDFTCDMYDTECDDNEWLRFLKILTDPLDEKGTAEQADDDADDDPEFVVLEDACAYEHEDEEPESEDHDEEQSKNEADSDDSIAKCAEQGAEVIEKEKEQIEQINITGYVGQPVNVSEMIPCVVYVESNSWFNLPERLQLEQQMRMHIQLLCQSFILSYGNESFSEITESAIAFLEELKMFATHAQQNVVFDRLSSFYACNLDEALDILNKYKAEPSFANNVTDISNKCKAQQRSTNNPSRLKKLKNAILPHVKETIAHSKVFIYPDLLPTIPYRISNKKSSKIPFSRAEDNLIAMGLEQFAEIDSPITQIQTLLLSTKTEQQIKHRIKNVRSKGASGDNPIARYFKYKEWPQVPKCIRPFNPLCIVPPCYMPLEILPPWMAPYVSKPPLPVLAPLIQLPVEKILKVTDAVSKTLKCKQPDKRKYPPILPRTYVSPLKKISPILRKYHRRVVQMPSLCVATPVKPATVIRKPNLRALRPKEPLVDETAPSIFSCKSIQILPKKKPFAIVNPIMASKPEDVIESIVKDVSDKNVSSEITPAVREESREPVEDCNMSKPLDVSIQSENDKDTVAEVDSNDVTDSLEADVDDEEDLAALMAASSTICKKSSAVKKKNKQQRDLESSLALLSPSLMESDPKKEERDKLFAQMYLIRVMEALKDHPDQCERFLEVLCYFENSNKSTLQLYSEISEILKDHPLLIDDFAGFLLPEQARECGKYVQHKTLCKIREFLRKIEVHFANQPHHIQRILRAFTQLRQQNNLTASAVMTTLQPLLKNQSHLVEELMQLLPDGAPPECLMMDSDFEEIRIPNSDGENSADSFEEIVIPETKDPYGGKDCPCSCHTSVTDVRMANRSRHCSKCGTKFIDGRIYIQTGKVLKPAHVTYHEAIATSKSPSKEGKADGFPNSTLFCVSTSDTGIHSKPRTLPSVLESNESRISKKCTASSAEPSQQAAKPQKDLLKAATENLGIESCLSSVPCYVEDAVLLPDTGNKDMDIPSDFSCISQVISAVANSQGSKSSSSTIVVSTLQSSVKKNNVEASGSSQQTFSLSKAPTISQPLEDSSNSIVSLPPKQWTKEEDALILDTCEKYGLNLDAFQIAAAAISTRTAQQVQSRFFELMEFAKNHLKASNR